MKHVIFSFLAILAAANALASNYPPSASNVNVSLVAQGPAVFFAGSYVGGTAEFIAYKPTGVLAKGNPDSIDAVITSTCYGNFGSVQRKQSVIKLGREWHGEGYMSVPLRMSDFSVGSCAGYSWNVEVAFSDGQGNWDSRYGQNYSMSQSQLMGYGPNSIKFDSNQGADWGEISRLNQRSWDFILDQMRK